MKVVDPGHCYLLDSLDGDAPQTLIFVKRQGAKYPGNIGSHPGTTMQEVLRALVERAEYVNAQWPCAETQLAIGQLKAAIYLFEVRAARTHGRVLAAPLPDVVSGATRCPACGHVGCSGGCRPDRPGGG